MSKVHLYKANITWTGNTGAGTSNYTSYQRNYSVKVDGKPEISGSSDPVFRGDKSKYNPEDLLLISLSACHMLWFLHLCADKGIIVENYTDHAEGKMATCSDGITRFTEAILNPIVTVRNEINLEFINSIHQEANKLCFIANSVNFPVKHMAKTLITES